MTLTRQWTHFLSVQNEQDTRVMQTSKPFGDTEFWRQKRAFCLEEDKLADAGQPKKIRIVILQWIKGPTINIASRLIEITIEINTNETPLQKKSPPGLNMNSEKIYEDFETILRFVRLAATLTTTQERSSYNVPDTRSGR